MGGAYITIVLTNNFSQILVVGYGRGCCFYDNLLFISNVVPKPANDIDLAT